MKSCEGCRATLNDRADFYDDKNGARCLADTRDIEAFVEKYQDWSWSQYEAPGFVVTVLAGKTYPTFLADGATREYSF
jgi:hypothetical protein